MLKRLMQYNQAIESIIITVEDSAIACALSDIGIKIERSLLITTILVLMFN
jgi:hypothetical protein